MKLARKHANEIASIFNSIQCAELMMESARKSKDWAQYDRSRNHWARELIALSDQYGINLPNLSRAREHIAENMTYWVAN